MLENRRELQDVWEEHSEHNEELKSPHPRPTSVSGVPLDVFTFSEDDIDEERHGPLPNISTLPTSSLPPQDLSDMKIHSSLFAVNPMFDSSESVEKNQLRVFQADGEENPETWRKASFMEQTHGKASDKFDNTKPTNPTKKQNISKLSIKNDRDKPNEFQITCFDKPRISGQQFVLPSSLNSPSFNSNEAARGDDNATYHPGHSPHSSAGNQHTTKKTSITGITGKKHVHSETLSLRHRTSSCSSSARVNPFVQPEKEKHDDSKGMDDVSPFHPQTEEEITSHALEIQRRPMSAGSQTHETVVSTGKESDSDGETTQSNSILKREMKNRRNTQNLKQTGKL
uniref:Uncharacterized protein LOC111109251 n=1 Tax=Crassostrea virginica TaxID=6565 RepID=A0A8B8BC89_CRAVI|nr:uncharacterized protein LOC111109251 [Crassostrea virginica]